MDKVVIPNSAIVQMTIDLLKAEYGTCQEYEYGCEGCEATRVVAFLEEVIKEL